MPREIVIRRARPDENGPIHAFVQAIADETFAPLFVVKANTRAVEFYRKRGWTIHREFLHEKFGHAMLELNKWARNPSATRLGE